MITCIVAVVVPVVSLSLYLYVSGVFNTFYLGAFRFAVYILLFFIFALTVWIGFISQPYEGSIRRWTRLKSNRGLEAKSITPPHSDYLRPAGCLPSGRFSRSRTSYGS